MSMIICQSCLELYEEGGQPCRCRTQPGKRVFPNLDFDEQVHLCECCAGEGLGSGSRWSIWFCGPCKLVVTTINDLLGAPLIPIGRHSIMHGLALRPSERPDDERARGFLDALGGLFERMEHLHRWQRALLAERLELLGFAGDVPLDDYLAALSRTWDYDGKKAHRVGRGYAVKGMLAHFGVSSLRP